MEFDVTFREIQNDLKHKYPLECIASAVKDDEIAKILRILRKSDDEGNELRNFQFEDEEIGEDVVYYVDEILSSKKNGAAESMLNWLVATSQKVPQLYQRVALYDACQEQVDLRQNAKPRMCALLRPANARFFIECRLPTLRKNMGLYVTGLKDKREQVYTAVTQRIIDPVQLTRAGEEFEKVTPKKESVWRPMYKLLFPYEK